MWVYSINKHSQGYGDKARQPYGSAYKKGIQEEKSEKVNTHKQASKKQFEANTPIKLRSGQITPKKSEHIFVEHLQQIVNKLTNTSKMDYFIDLCKENMFCERQRRVRQFIIGEYDTIKQSIKKQLYKLRLVEMMKTKMTFQQQKQAQRNPMYYKKLNEIVHYSNSLKLILAIYKQKDVSLQQLKISALSPSHRRFLKSIIQEKYNSPNKKQKSFLKAQQYQPKQEPNLELKRNNLLSSSRKEREIQKSSQQDRKIEEQALNYIQQLYNRQQHFQKQQAQQIKLQGQLQSRANTIKAMERDKKDIVDKLKEAKQYCQMLEDKNQQLLVFIENQKSLKQQQISAIKKKFQGDISQIKALSHAQLSAAKARIAESDKNREQTEKIKQEFEKKLSQQKEQQEKLYLQKEKDIEKSYKSQTNQIRQELKQAKQRNSLLEAEAKELAQTVVDLKQSSEKNEKQVLTQLQRIKEVEQQNKELNAGLCSQRSELNECKGKEQSLLKENNRLKNQLQKQGSQLTRKIQENTQQNLSQLQRLKGEVAKLKESLNEKEQLERQLRQKNSGFIDQCNQLQEKNQQLQASLSVLKQEYELLQTKANEEGNPNGQSRQPKMQDLSNIQKQREGLQNQKKQLQGKLNKQQSQLTTALEENSGLIEQINTLKAQIVQLQKRTDQQQQLSKKDKQIKRLQQLLEQREAIEVRAWNQRQEDTVINSEVRHLFHGDTLRNRDDFKLYLKTTIQKYMGIRIHDTKLIYSFDTLNSNNIHKYVDKKAHIVLVVKLVSGFYLAAYYEGAFKPKHVSDKEGLIISLTNQQYFTTVERNKKATVYDEYYIIFGNSELRLKSQQKKIFSNFGLNNGYYKHKGNTVSILLGGEDKERQMELISYEVYQLILE